MVKVLLTAALAMLFATGCATRQDSSMKNSDLRQQVMETERGFAQTMARRDFVAFKTFLADDTVFFDRDRPIRGKEQVAASWRVFFEKPDAPFSWEPKEVEVLDAGNLAISSGPVRDPQGKVFATFTSIWQLQQGSWKIVFDKGSKHCE